MNTQQQNGTRPQAEAAAWPRRTLTVALVAATIGTGALVGATAFGADGAQQPGGQVRPAEAPAAPTQHGTVDPLMECFGSYRAIYRWLEHGHGSPQQCYIARSTGTKGSAGD